MKNLKLFVFLMVSFSIYSADDNNRNINYTIGPVDRAVLKTLVNEKGLKIVQKEIHNHEFHTKNPYTIEYIVKKSDQSILSFSVFNNMFLIYQSMISLPNEWGYFQTNPKENPLNAIHDNTSSLSKARIDYCTLAKTLDQTLPLHSVPDTICIRTEFYNKKVLLEALDE